MTFHSNQVMVHFRTTKHVIAPRVYWYLRKGAMSGGSTSLREIAFFIGSNRMSVSRALRLLRNMGVVEYRRQSRGISVDKVLDYLP